MLTLPKIVYRDARPYAGIARTVQLPFDDVVDVMFAALFSWLDKCAATPSGPPFIKYNVIDMAHDLEVEFGAPVAGTLAASGEVKTGTLPAGRYATLSNFGPYDELMDVTAMLNGWARELGYAFDLESTPKGDKFASRLEIYTTDPRTVPDPKDWETVLEFKLGTD